MMVAIDFSHAIPLLSLPTGELLIRLFLIAGGILVIYGGIKEILEPLIMIPFGLGVASANAAYLALKINGVVLVNPHVAWNLTSYDWISYFWLQPIYNFTFMTGLIAALVFMGIGVLTDISFLLARPYVSMILAAFAELGTVFTFPIGTYLGLTTKQAASVALIGGADGPIVLFSSIVLAPELFIPITVVGYLYLSLLYLYHERLAEVVIPKSMASKIMPPSSVEVGRAEKIAFAIIVPVLLSAIFPSASPLLLSFFIGVLIREVGNERYVKLLDEVILSVSTFFLALVLGVSTTADAVMDPVVGKILLLGITALFLSSLGGMIGGIILSYLSRGKLNPLLGVAGVSCVPTTAKLAQKLAFKLNPDNYMIMELMGPNVAGVITTAIVAALYLSALM
ncbi:MAG: sodium ion-translocating decarboxylase subunit beta [Fervidicoccaceae archaeon]|jgi:oxaloacetate decarboxylase beta subunit